MRVELMTDSSRSLLHLSSNFGLGDFFRFIAGKTYLNATCRLSDPGGRGKTGVEKPSPNRRRGLPRARRAGSGRRKRAPDFSRTQSLRERRGRESEDTRILAGAMNNPSIYNRGAGGVRSTSSSPISAARPISRPVPNFRRRRKTKTPTPHASRCCCR